MQAASPSDVAPPVASIAPRIPDYAGALSVVVPVHNEADNIDRLVEEIHAALAGRAEFELIYVDDGSTDDTAQRLAQAARRFPRLRVLRHARSCGQSTAIATGVRAARHPWVATLDGDGQNDPSDIPLMLEHVRAGHRPPRLALVAGWRTQRQDTLVRRWSSRVANGVRGRLLGDHMPDTGCGLKLFPRDLFLRLPFFDHMHRFLPALMLREGVQVASVPVRHRERTAGQSKYGIANRLWVGIVDMAGVMWLNRRMRRPEAEA